MLTRREGWGRLTTGNQFYGIVTFPPSCVFSIHLPFDIYVFFPSFFQFSLKYRSLIKETNSQAHVPPVKVTFVESNCSSRFQMSNHRDRKRYHRALWKSRSTIPGEFAGCEVTKAKEIAPPLNTVNNCSLSPFVLIDRALGSATTTIKGSSSSLGVPIGF